MSRTACVAILVAAFAGAFGADHLATAGAQEIRKPVVIGFHHVHMNVVDPGRSVAFYTQNFRTRAVNVAGWDGVRSEDVHILFNKVERPASYEWDTALWHFGWTSQAPVDDYKRIAANGVKFFRVPPPSAHLVGPDNEDVEIATGEPLFNHVHLQAEAPFCTADWYERVLGLRHPPDPLRVAGADCKVPYPARSAVANQYLNPNGRVLVGGIALFVYPDQRLHALTPNPADDRGPLVSPRGRIIDHIAMTVADVSDAVRRLRAEGVTVLEDVHAFGTSTLKAAMIEGPDKVAIELVEDTAR